MKKIIAILGIMFSVNSFAADDVLISACVNKITKNMRHINAPQACKRTEYLLSWNQKGPQGIQGVVGPQGPAGTGSTSICTQESLAGTWLPDTVWYGTQPGGIIQIQKIVVDSNGNFTLNSWEDDKYDENGNILGRINKNQSGTLKISATQNTGCTVEWDIITQETYVNSGDSFPLSPDSSQTFFNMKLNNEADEIKWNEFGSTSTYDENGNVTGTTDIVVSFKLLRMQNGN